MKSPFLFCRDLWHCSFNVKNVSGCKFGSFFCLIVCFLFSKDIWRCSMLMDYLGIADFLPHWRKPRCICSFYSLSIWVMWIDSKCELLIVPKEISFVMMIIHLNNFGLILCYFLKVFLFYVIKNYKFIVSTILFSVSY